MISFILPARASSHPRKAAAAIIRLADLRLYLSDNGNPSITMAAGRQVGLGLKS